MDALGTNGVTTEGVSRRISALTNASVRTSSSNLTSRRTSTADTGLQRSRSQHRSEPFPAHDLPTVPVMPGSTTARTPAADLFANFPTDYGYIGLSEVTPPGLSATATFVPGSTPGAPPAGVFAGIAQGGHPPIQPPPGLDNNAHVVAALLEQNKLLVAQLQIMSQQIGAAPAAASSGAATATRIVPDGRLRDPASFLAGLEEGAKRQFHAWRREAGNRLEAYVIFQRNMGNLASRANSTTNCEQTRTSLGRFPSTIWRNANLQCILLTGPMRTS